MKPGKFLILGTIGLLTCFSCQEARTVEKDFIAFTSQDIVQKSFGGLGVEWGTYEDTDKIVEGGWERIIAHMDHLKPARIRLMVSYDWFCQNFDGKGTDDKNDDTWTYNLTNKYAKNTIEILEYCQIHNIDVAFGAWNVIANLSGEDVWGMMEEVTSDIRWAKITGDILDYLVNKKGFDCIKWFVNSNEPNYSGNRGSSKNYNNTYDKWEQGVKNVRATLDSLGLKSISIVGGDTTGYAGTEEYLTNIARNIPEQVGDYGFHLYLSNIAVDRGEMFDQINSIYKKVKDIDGGLGVKRQANVWEAGLLDGKTLLDCQTAIRTGNYAVRMVDYTIQCLAAGVNGVVYWDFDDAMHFMYTATTMTPKEWGMFSSLAEATSNKQELRPWYHSSSLLCHMIKKGNLIYSPPQNDNNLDKTFRSIATRSQDGKQGGFVAVNAGLASVNKTFYIDDEIEGDKLYVYIFNGSSYRLDESGYIIPNYEIEGSLNKKFTIDVPQNSAVVVSNERL
ncbi:MAG: hypothetical protein IJ247_05480 [Bacilli bacterium]|nr:hypothetical protein [Bacilli bacterium]